MKLKRWLTLVMVLTLLAVCFAGCGASESAKDSYYQGSNGATPEMDGGSGLTQTGEVPESASTTTRKLIRTVKMTAETENMDDLLPQIDSRVNELGGYVESREIYNGSKGSTRSRYANLVIRIPAAKLDQFIAQVGEASNIVSKNESTEDVTLSYVAVESRIKALETEEVRLLELLAKAESMDDILQINSRLSEVRGELETVKSQLRTYDNLVDYGTLHLNIDEVREYTEPVEEPEGFWERVTTGFAESMKNTGMIIEEVTIGLLVGIPYMLPGLTALLLTGIVFWIVFAIVWRKKKKNKK